MVLKNRSNEIRIRQEPSVIFMYIPRYFYRNTYKNDDCIIRGTLVPSIIRTVEKVAEKLLTVHSASSVFLSTMAIRVVEFSNGGYKIRKIFA